MKIDVPDASNIEIVGLFDTEVSKVDNTFYISSKKTNKPGHPGTFAMYADEHGTVESAGLGLEYDREHEVLVTTTVTSTYLNTDHIDTNNIATINLSTDQIVSKNISTSHIDANQIVSKNISTSHIDANDINTSLLIANSINASNSEIFDLTTRYIHFLNKNDNTRFASIHSDYFKEETLAVVTERGDGTSGCAVVIDKMQRVAIDEGRLNLRQKRTILSSIGDPNDKQGDIAIDNNYLYYCTKNYNGNTNIWIRWAVTDTNW